MPTMLTSSSSSRSTVPIPFAISTQLSAFHAKSPQPVRNVGKLLHRPCQIRLSQEPNHCQMLPPEVCAALSAIGEATYMQRRDKGYNRYRVTWSVRQYVELRSGKYRPQGTYKSERWSTRNSLCVFC
eukprot:gb/GEZJ01003894.1/.p4 GENE.gb/GEZJ01003894.1/~~gb/GEZJ01003894.1/.p4  ORF type:complete len:127 (+),score=4.54 gb/GEZJ01003894.1/:2124-2504(+)